MREEDVGQVGTGGGSKTSSRSEGGTGASACNGGPQQQHRDKSIETSSREGLVDKGVGAPGARMSEGCVGEEPGVGRGG